MSSSRSRTTQATTVLVADDDPIFRQLVAARLVKLNGHAVEAEDGAVAWELLSSQPFDVAVVDLNMPGLDGIDLIQCIRGFARTQHLPVVVITSQNDIETIKAALEAGATAFITKPVNWTLFEHHLGSLLRLAASERKFRTTLQLMAATSRAKDVIVEGLSAQVAASAAGVKSRIAEILTSVDRNTAAATALRDVAAEIECLKGASERACRFASILSNDLDASDQTVPLHEIIDELLHAVSPEASARSIDIRVTANAQSANLRCDKASIQLAIGELLHNAIMYSAPGQSVTIKTHSYPDGMLSIEISDHGCGMHPDVIARVLGGREITGTRHSVSTEVGFGLPLAKAVAQSHGGNLEIRSMPGQGLSALFFFSPERVSLTSMEML